MTREIVDESDVYVDVHKAIRRLTPAPRARSGLSDATAAAGTAGTAVAARKTVDGTAFVNTTESADGTQLKVGSLGALSDNAGEVAYRPKTAVFMKRRGSAGPDGRPEGPVPVKASLEEMRQNLRLGPANSAAHPRSARKNVFKIKQGLARTNTHGSIPETPAERQGEPVLGQGEPVNGGGDERTPLLGNNDENGATTVKPYEGSDKSKRRKNGKSGKNGKNGKKK